MRQDRVLVTGLEVFDAKGRVIRRYEPFFDTGHDFVPPGPRGSAVETAYDPLDRMIRIVNPDGSQRRTVFGLPSPLTDPDSIEPTPWVQTGYDENDLAAVSVGPDGASLAGRAPADQHDTPTSTLQDGLGRTVCVLSRGAAEPSSWRLTRTAYELDGSVREVVDELGRSALVHHHDLLGRKLVTESIDAGRSVSVLDATDRPRYLRDATGTQQLQRYDALGRLTEVWASDGAHDPVTLRIRNSFGDGGTALQPAADRQAARATLRLGRPDSSLDEAGLSRIAKYDLTGGPAEQSRRLVSDATLAALAVDADWQPDWSAMDPNQLLDASAEEILTVYDALGRVIQRTLPPAPAVQRPVLTATFTRTGGVRSVVLDGQAHLELVVHNARGQRLFQAYGNGLVSRFGYDPATFRLVRRRTEPMTRAGNVWTSSGAPLEDLTFSYDLIGNLTSIEERTPGCGIAGTAAGRDVLVRTFSYDGFSRLVAATGRECVGIAGPRPLDDHARCGWIAPGAAAPNSANAPDLVAGYEEAYHYDPIGNLLDLHHRRTTGPPQEWHRLYGLGGQLPENWATAPNSLLTTVHAGQTTESLGYDAAGQLTSQNMSQSFRFDHAGRLTSYRVHAGNAVSVLARYLYDSGGRRVKKWVRRGGNAAQDASISYQAEVFERHRWAQAGGGSNVLVLLGHDGVRFASVRLGPSHPDNAGPATRYELTDELGSCLLSVDLTGGWISREEYLPYGETSFGGFARKRFRFVGKERDEESGLIYHGARYYAPGLARWTSPDPADAGAGPPRVYTYCGGRPLVAADPDGAHPVLIIIVMAVLVSLAIPNVANAPGPNDVTYPHVTEAEFAVKAGAMLACGPAGGAVEAQVATRVGVGLGGRVLSGMAGGVGGGGVIGLGFQAGEDVGRGRLSTPAAYGKSIGVNMAIGAPLGAVGGVFRGGPAATMAKSPYTDLEVRQWVNDAEKVVEAYQKTPAFKQLSVKQQAQLSVTLRRSITGEARSMMENGGQITEVIKGFEQFVGKSLAETDAARYGSGGRTFDNLYKKNAAAIEASGAEATPDAVYRRMVEGSTRPNPDVNVHVGAKR